MTSRKKKMTKGEAWKIAHVVQMVMAKANIRCAVCGSLRRGLLEVNDVDLVIEPPIKRAVTVLEHSEEIKELGFELFTKNGEKSIDFVVGEVPFNAIETAPDGWGAAIMHLTGSKFFNVVMRARAKNQGLKLNQYGLWGPGGEQIAGIAESQIFDALGIPYIDPKDREKGRFKI